MPSPHASRRTSGFDRTTPPPAADGRTPASGRPRPQLLAILDGSAASTQRLVWTLQEAARRDASVVAVAALDAAAAESRHTDARTLLESELRHAIAAAGVRARCRTALVDPLVLAVLTATARGGELVLAGPHGGISLRPAVPRPPARRRLVHGA